MSHFSLKYFFLFFFFINFSKLYSQVPLVENKTILYKQENVYGITINNNGFGISYKNSRNITGSKKFDICIDFVNIKDDKEYKVFSENENAKGFVYGKLSSLYVLRTGLGLQRKLFEKPEKRGVEIKYNISGGLSTAFLKPVYLYIKNYSRISYDYVLTSEKYDPNKHDLDNIFGRAPIN
ncbi:MAG: hypothetical protein A2X12_11770, partial [Bacteroidetes bacterium GWE2_29_8]